jgi:enoyl-CoA hydratase/carnithine racemase
MAGDAILVERLGRVLRVTFNRPAARNAMTFAMYERLYEICDEIDANRELRCVVFTGAGHEAFVAGTDISEFRNFGGEAEALEYERRMERVFSRLEDVKIPILAAIAGACTGGGAGIAAACDLRIAGPAARFGFPVARTLGNCLSIGNYARFVALIGAGQVKQMLYTAELFDARRMYELGFLNEITETDASVGTRALEIAERIAGNAPLTISATKEALRRIARGQTSGGDDLILRCYTSRDFREGMTAFLEKRPADWRGE